MGFRLWLDSARRVSADCPVASGRGGGRRFAFSCARGRAGSGRDGFADDGGVLGDDAEEDFGGAGGVAAAVLPTASDVAGEQIGERGLAQAEPGAHDLGGFGCDPAGAAGLRAPRRMARIPVALCRRSEKVSGFCQPSSWRGIGWRWRDQWPSPADDKKSAGLLGPARSERLRLGKRERWVSDTPHS